MEILILAAACMFGAFIPWASKNDRADAALQSCYCRGAAICSNCGQHKCTDCQCDDIDQGLTNE